MAPRFPKVKDEGWFLILGEVDKKELIALKRTGYVRNRNTVSVAFYTPETPGKYDKFRNKVLLIILSSKWLRPNFQTNDSVFYFLGVSTHCIS